MTDVQKQRARRRGPRLVQRMVTTAAAWLAAYLVVNVVVAAGGNTLAAAPRPVQTLVISGALVIVMVNVLMPAIGGVVARLLPARH